jgi:hypothetical protein
VLILEGRSIRIFPGVTGLPGVSGFFPDIPGLRAVTILFCVRGIKAPSTLSSLSLSHTRPFRTAKLQNSFSLLFTPLGSKLVRFGRDLRGIESKSLESASELISHL